MAGHYLEPRPPFCIHDYVVRVPSLRPEAETGREVLHSEGEEKYD